MTTPEDDTEFVDEWSGKDALRLISEPPWTGQTTFKRQAPGRIREHTNINAAFDRMNKLYRQGGEIVFFYDRDLPKSQKLQKVSRSILGRVAG